MLTFIQNTLHTTSASVFSLDALHQTETALVSVCVAVTSIFNCLYLCPQNAARLLSLCEYAGVWVLLHYFLEVIILFQLTLKIHLYLDLDGTSVTQKSM